MHLNPVAQRRLLEGDRREESYIDINPVRDWGAILRPNPERQGLLAPMLLPTRGIHPNRMPHYPLGALPQVEEIFTDASSSYNIQNNNNCAAPQAQGPNVRPTYPLPKFTRRIAQTPSNSSPGMGHGALSETALNHNGFSTAQAVTPPRAIRSISCANLPGSMFQNYDNTAQTQYRQPPTHLGAAGVTDRDAECRSG